jgi:hypothetical protein
MMNRTQMSKEGRGKEPKATALNLGSPIGGIAGHRMERFGKP